MVSARLGSVFALPRLTTSGVFLYYYDLFTELRSLLENEANWYQSKKYCESQGLTLSEVEPGDGPDGILADYYRRRYGGIWSLKWTQSVTKSISAKTLTVCQKSVGTMLECLTLCVILILPLLAIWSTVCIVRQLDWNIHIKISIFLPYHNFMYFPQ